MTTTVTMWDWDDIYNTVKKKLRDFFHLEVEVDYYGFNTDDELQMFIGYPDTPVCRPFELLLRALRLR